MIVGIDATNLRQGGGCTHLIELLRAADPEAQGVERVFVWGSEDTLEMVDNRPWLEKVNPIDLFGGLLRRSLWQRFSLSVAARASGCSVLFVPGGSYLGTFHPVVTMSQNMLPFEWRELRRYGGSIMTLKLILLRLTQSRSFRAADGIIFLTDYAKHGVMQVTGPLKGKTMIIPHGLSSRFLIPPRPQRPITAFSVADPYRLLYVSNIDQYKHQWQVVEAVARLRQATGWPIFIDLVGPAYPLALRRLQDSLKCFDPKGQWVRYNGAMPYSELHTKYAKADLGVFASSCENMPITLLEAMASGLPIACSNRGPMQAFLGDGGVFFDPEQPEDIARSLQRLIESTELRARQAHKAYTTAKAYKWSICAKETFSFLAETGTLFKKQTAGGGDGRHS